MLKTRSSLLIAGSSLIALLAMTSQSTAAAPQLPLNAPFTVVHNAQISSCQWRDNHNQPCRPPANNCRCIRPPRVIQGGGGTPGAVEVRRAPGTHCRWEYSLWSDTPCPSWTGLVGTCELVCPR